ncbi:similar to Saccharomyces cerevisiae YIL024C Putative protein of unknown function [Maudiozyma saulgeensis]|uniref:AMP-activated protein kinase glycogen-binding domain-containing protein n=1 Tax=Maudiozyma saulgeensis TaxID=1789683 RepID=A0A1X7R7C9_9SACH|nr:similar to Saccharomyces cerevisiae YIL024C Putative protein of unknown function [Kazachstania saulgeensis]
MSDTVLLQIPITVLQEKLKGIQSFENYKPPIMVAGEFNNWRHDSTNFQLKINDIENLYSIDLPKMPGKTQFVFKLYIPDVTWFTVPYFDTVIDETGNVNNIIHYEPLQINNEVTSPFVGSISDYNSNDYVEIKSLSELSSAEEILNQGSESPNQITDSIYGSTIDDYYNLDGTPQNSVVCSISQSSKLLGSSQTLSGVQAFTQRVKKYFNK